MKSLIFLAEVRIIGVNPYVLLPEAVLSALFVAAKKEKGTIPVKGKINGHPFMQTLVKYSGDWRLYINGVMKKAAKVDVGDVVTMEISYDAKPRLEPMHTSFEYALKKNPQAKKVFDSFSPSRKKEINRYLNNMKTKESLLKNIEKVMQYLTGDKKRKYFVLVDRSPKNYRDNS